MKPSYAQLGLTLMAYDLGKRENWSAALGYETQLFRSDFSEHYFNLQLGRPF